MKRITALLLTIIMIINMLPLQAFAEELPVEEHIHTEEQLPELETEQDSVIEDTENSDTTEETADEIASETETETTTEQPESQETETLDIVVPQEVVEEENVDTTQSTDNIEDDTVEMVELFNGFSDTDFFLKKGVLNDGENHVVAIYSNTKNARIAVIHLQDGATYHIKVKNNGTPETNRMRICTFKESFSKIHIAPLASERNMNQLDPNVVSTAQEIVFWDNNTGANCTSEYTGTFVNTNNAKTLVIFMAWGANASLTEVSVKGENVQIIEEDNGVPKDMEERINILVDNVAHENEATKRIMDVAYSFWEHRDEFIYCSGTALDKPWDYWSYEGYVDSSNTGKVVTLKNAGYKRIDCSTFVKYVINGIDYYSTPYYNALEHTTIEQGGINEGIEISNSDDTVCRTDKIYIRQNKKIIFETKNNDYSFTKVYGFDGDNKLVQTLENVKSNTTIKLQLNVEYIKVEMKVASKSDYTPGTDHSPASILKCLRIREDERLEINADVPLSGYRNANEICKWFDNNKYSVDFDKESLDYDDIKVGTVIFWGRTSGTWAYKNITHTSLYIGDGYILHVTAPYGLIGGEGILIEPIDEVMDRYDIPLVAMSSPKYHSVESHQHTYLSLTIAPTCTEQGYTTYTCDCGDSYVEDYTDKTNHNFKNGVCILCGDSVLNMGYTHAVPENQGVANAIERAYQLTDVEWTPVADMPGVKKINGEYTVITFKSGETYRGIPYSGVIATDTYVGLNVSLESFLTALKNKNSVLYTENLHSTNPKSATYFGTVCSKFAQYVLDVPGSFNTNNVANIPGMDTIAMPGKYTVDDIKLGDVVLHTSDHTTVCTDILYDSDGNVAYIEISEAVLPQVRRMLWSPEEFYEHFSGYRLCRYQYTKDVPEAEIADTDGTYALMPRFGDKYNYKVSSTKGVVDVLESGYSKAVIIRDGVTIDEIELNGATSFKFDRSVPGYLEMYLEKADGTRSGSVYACVVKSSVKVTDSTSFLSGEMSVKFDGSSGTPLYVQVGSGQSVFCSVKDIEGSEAIITFNPSRVSGETIKVRVAYQNEYGIYLSSWVSHNIDLNNGTGPNPSTDTYLSKGVYWDGYNITPSSHIPVIQENKVGYWSYTMVPVEENTKYYSWGATRMWYLDVNGDPISTVNVYKDSSVACEFTTPEGAAYINVAYSSSLVEKGTETLEHTHTYTSTVTPPTCTQQGYTTYTCDCGDSYVSDYVDIIEHIYKNGICSLCKHEVSSTLIVAEFVNGTYSGNALTSSPNTRLRHDPISVKSGDKCSFSLPDGWSGYICLAYQEQNWDYTPKAWVQEYSYTFQSNTDAFVVMRKDDGSVISPEDYEGEITFTRAKDNLDSDIKLQGYYQKEIDKTIESLKAVIGDERCLVFPMVSDIHYLKSAEVPNSFDYFIANLKELSKEIDFDFIACLGDVTEGDASQEITSERNAHIINGFTQLGIPYYQVIGNHDDNRYGDAIFSHEQLYENYLSTITDVVFDTSSMHKTNYYKDFDDIGIRCIFLNANTNGAYGYSNETCDWFDEAIKTEKGVIVFTHIPPIPSQNYGERYGIDSGSARIRETCKNADNFLVMFSGHNHYDLTITEPFLSYTMNCQKFENENGDPSLWAEGAIKPQRVVGTETEDCFDIVVVRPESGRIDLIRFGAGEDKSLQIEPMYEQSYPSYDEALLAARQAMVARQSVIPVQFFSETSYIDFTQDFFSDATAHTGNPKEGDYLVHNMDSRYFSNSSKQELNGGWLYTFDINITWWTTAEQEAEMDAAVDSLLSQLNLWNKEDYYKIRGVYDYICDTITYDYDNLNNSDYKLKQTAYAALIHKTCVCEGYATLFYRLMLELGIDSRVIVGYAGESHAWNIVKLNNVYYNMDPTWDAGITVYYRYFLCTPYDFRDHTRNVEYDNSQFHAQYPMATMPFVVNVAASGTTGGLTWVLDGDTGELKISGTGNMPNYGNLGAPWYKYFENITSIVLSEGITSVGDYAFVRCKYVTSVTLPSTLTKIGKYGFDNCRALKEITLPEGLTTISTCAFSECIALKEIVIPGSVKTFGSSIFSNSYNLAKVTFAEGMTHIPDSMFYNSDGLTYVNFPSTIVEIGDTAFRDCDKLQYVTIPAGVRTLGYGVFSDCTSLRNIYVEEGNKYYKDVDGVLFTMDEKTLVTFPAGRWGTYTIPDGTVRIGDAAFCRAKSMTDIIIPDSVTYIGEYAFTWCDKLTDVTIGKNVTQIGDTAYGYCKGLKTVTFLNPNTKLDWHVFTDCIALTSITLPANLTQLDTGLLSDCDKLTSVEIPSGVKIIGDSAFTCNDGITSITLPKGVYSIGYCAFDRAKNLKEIYIPGNISKIDWSAFDDCISLRFIRFGGTLGGVYTIEKNKAFGGCTNLTAVYFDNASAVSTITGQNSQGGLVYYAKTIAMPASATPTNYIKNNYTNVSTVSYDGIQYKLYSDHSCSFRWQTKEYVGNASIVTYACSVCDARQHVTNCSSHTYETVTTQPTCDAQGTTVYTCRDCKYNYTIYTPALGHDYQLTYTWLPGCTYEGYNEFCCSRCGDYIVEEVPPAGHSLQELVIPPTCTENGYSIITCSVCDEIYYQDNFTDPLGHTEQIIEGKAPTCTETGVSDGKYCSVCDEVLAEQTELPATGHSYNNGKCVACGCDEWDTDCDGVLEILAIGNSFSVDALEYAYQIAQNIGIEKIVIGNLYIGGCSLNTHATNVAGDLAKYTYYYNDNGKWKSTSGYKVSTALSSRSWDYVSLQQASGYSGQASTYNKDLTTLITYVQENSDAKLVWHMTWAYQQDSTHRDFPKYDSNQITMYNAILSAVQSKIATNEAFDLIIPNGTAVQNSRTSALGDTTTRDGYHMSYDYGRYLTGLTFIKTLTGLSIDNVTYAPDGVGDEQMLIAIESANNAYNKPFEITQSQYAEPIPEKEYIMLELPIYQGAYWHPLKEGRYNELLTDMSNSSKYFTTVRFTKETLPVGSYIVLKDGWQYRPDGWVTDELQTGTREPITTKSPVTVTESWWADYTIRSFNVSRVNGNSVMDLTEAEMRDIFQIYVPKDTHTHNYSKVFVTPTCTHQGYTTYTCLCGDSYVADYTDATGVHSYVNGVCINCGANIKWEQGTIASADGTNNTNSSRLRTADYLYLSDFGGVGINRNYTMTNFVYDKDFNYLGTSSWLGTGRGFEIETLQSQYPDGVYFRIALRREDNKTIDLAELEATGITLYGPDEDVPAREDAIKYTDIGSIGTRQDGDIYDGKLFVFDGAGSGTVFDLGTLTQIGKISLDKSNILKPHANTVSFGNTYYAQGDKYPLLYINIYNNYASATDRMEGTCCVYRIIETANGFSTQLVQVIKIGFTEDLSLWKSKENNGDTRPYGNFLVDKDTGKLYAYVMRDATYTTRFFSFDLPEMTDGVYNGSYDCNVVTLEKDDILWQFDTEYFNIIQGGTIYDGKILSVEGHSNGYLRVVDTQRKTVNSFSLAEVGLTTEPEVLCADDKGKVYYAAADGVLRVLTIPDKAEKHSHFHSAEITVPTCTEQGYTTYICLCGDSYVADYVNALGHTEVIDKAVAPTCTDSGLTEGKHCSVCTVVLVKQEVVKALGHNYNSTVTAPSCTVKGYTNHICTVCGDTYTDSYVNALGHTVVIDTAIAPTCTNTGLTEGKHCSVCNEVLVEKTELPATGHSWRDWTEEFAPTCDKEGKDKRICNNCNEMQYRDTRISGDSNKIQVSNPVVSDYFTGKKIVFLGDSVTYGSFIDTVRTDAYPYVVGNSLGAVVSNKAVSGSSICTGGHVTVNETLVYEKIEGADVVTILLGVNDFNHAVKNGIWQGTQKYDITASYYDLGDYNSTDTSEYYGALRSWCEKIVEFKKMAEFENTQFIFITMPITARNRSVTNTNDWNQTKVNIYGHTLREYCTAIMEICADYDIPVFDANMYSGIYYNSPEDNNVDLTGGADGIHPSAAGHALIAESLKEFLLENYSYEERTIFDNGHSYEKIVTSPTCLANGYTTYKCIECHYKYNADEVITLGHNWDSGVVTEQPTEEATGLKKYTCENCGETKTEVIPTLDHIHQYTNTTVAPTCTEKGYTKYECKCGDTYADSYKNALGHKSVTDAAVAATCTETGLTKGSHCSRCNEILTKQEVVPAKGHSYNAIVTKPSCTQQGYTTYTCSVCKHSYTDNYVSATGHTAVVDSAVLPTCTRTGLTEGSHCSVCNTVLLAQKVVKATGHKSVIDNAVAPTCTQTGLSKGTHCSKCNEVLTKQEVVPARGHSYNTTVTKPTCTEKGYATYICTRCDDTYTDNFVNALGHTEVIDKAVAPTCTETGLTEGKHCSVCMVVLVKQEVVNALGHSYKETVTAPSCTEKGYTTFICLVCEHTYTDNFVNALGHTEVIDKAVAPTCTETGLTEGKHCSVCSIILVAQQIVKATGHAWDEGIVTKEPTEETTGTREHTCENCGETKTETIPELDHVHKYTNTVVAPTCLEKGYTEHKCVCGDTYRDSYKNALGHKSVTDAAVAPTCTETGLTKGSHCSRCNEILTKQEIVPAKGHSVQITKGYAATCTQNGLTAKHTCKVCKEVLIEAEIIPALNHIEEILNAVEPTCTETGLTEGTYCSRCEEILVQQEEIEALGHAIIENVVEPTCTAEGYTKYSCTRCDYEYIDNYTAVIEHHYSDYVLNENGTQTWICSDCGKQMTINAEITDEELMKTIEIILDREYIIIEVEENSDVTATLNYGGVIDWSVEGDNVEISTTGELCEFTAVKPGTCYIVASAQFGKYVVTSRCRVDVTHTIPVETISAAHVSTTKVTSKIYSTDYAELDIHFDMLQLMSTMDADTPTLTDNGVSMMYAYFTDDTASQLYNLIVKDDRTLIIVPDLKYNDIKDFKTECKSTITVCVDFEEFETIETVTIKADKTLPTVKSTAVKLNSFYTNDTMPLVLTSNKGAVVSAQLDETKTNPDWLILNEDMTVTLKEGITGKASGKLYLDVYVANYAQPVKVAVSVSVANTPPKLKLSATKATFYTFRDNATATTIFLQSNDKKVNFADIGVTDIKVADISLMTSKDAKTYSANSNYAVTSYDKETGMFTLDVLNEAVSGKVLLEVSIDDSDQTVKLPITVTAYNKAPTFKLSKSSVTINTAYAPAGSTVKVNVTPTPADYAVTNDNFSWVVTDSKNNILDNVLDVSFESGTVTVSANENTLSNGKYKVVFTLDGVAKPVTLNVTVKPVTMKVSKSSVTLNKLADDSAVITLTTTPADYILSEENISYTVTDSKNNPVDAVDVEFDFSDMKAGKFVKLSVNENSTYGATYKVNFTLAETGKTSTVTVKTLAENKSVIKLSISAKGKLETGYLAKGVTITPKWTNLMQSVDISNNIRVYATAKTKGALPVDVTDRFTITETNGTYLLTFKDTDSMETLNPKDKYTVVCEGVTVKGQNVDDTKAITITFTVTKPKVTQDVKTVNLYLNDRYSRGEFKLTLADKTMPGISKIEIADVKMAEFYQIKDFGNGQYVIEFKDNNIAEKLKTGNIKLNIYLDGNNPVYKTPNATVTVKVNAVKFKAK